MRSRSPLAGARLSVARLIAVTPVIGAFLLFAYFGQELANRTPAQDVQAESWYFAADRPEVLSGPDAIAPMRELEPRAERDSQSGARAIGASASSRSRPSERGELVGRWFK